MYERKIIKVEVLVLSGFVTMLLLLLLLSLITATTSIPILPQEASSAFFHEKLFGDSSSSNNANAQLTTDVNPTTIDPQLQLPLPNRMELQVMIVSGLGGI